jgi:hypothetical protein
VGGSSGRDSAFLSLVVWTVHRKTAKAFTFFRMVREWCKMRMVIPWLRVGIGQLLANVVRAACIIIAAKFERSGSYI